MFALKAFKVQISLSEALEIYLKVISANVHWDKSEALWAGQVHVYLGT